MGSMTGFDTWYPVDDITVDMPCCFHIPLGRVGNKTKEVAIGVVIPGHVFHNNPNLLEYAKVLVQEITDKGYTNYPLNHVTPDGVKDLGEATNQFILWNRHKIFLDGPISPQKQRIQLSQTPSSSPIDHALAPPSGQQVPLCHTRFLCQNQVLIVCMTQGQLFHTYGQKCSQITKFHKYGV
jgi:hypothetical protein